MGDGATTAWRRPRRTHLKQFLGRSALVLIFGSLAAVAGAGEDVADRAKVLLVAGTVLIGVVPSWLLSLKALVLGEGVELTDEGVVVRKASGRTSIAWGDINDVETEGIPPGESIVLVVRSDASIRARGLARILVPRPDPPRFPGYVVIPAGWIEDSTGLDSALRRRLGLPARSHVAPPTAAAPATRPLDLTVFLPPPFPRVRLREGYDMGAVDAFAEALMQRARQDPPGISAHDVETARFAPVRLREGYDMGAVDVWLDKVVAELRR